MTTVVVTITDTAEGLSIEGRLEDPTALDEAPTTALIVGTYLAAHMEQVCKAAIRWFDSEARAVGGVEEIEDVEVQDAPRLIVPTKGLS